MESFGKYILLYSLLIIPVTMNAFSQNDTVSISTENDTIKSEPEASHHSLYSAAGYGSNMIYLGSTISENQPFGYASLTYVFRDEFAASFSAIHLSGYKPYLAFYSLTISYSHTFNSWLDISTGISRYQINNSAEDTLFSNFFFGDITLGFDWKILYSKISAGGLFSDQNRVYFQVKNSRYFQTPEFSRKNLYFSFDPYVNLLLGTLTKVETTTGNSVKISPPFRNHGSDNHTTINTKYSNMFGIMEVDFGIPVTFNAGRFTIEAEPSYLLPVYDDPDYPELKGTVFMLSIYFRIF